MKENIHNKGINSINNLENEEETNDDDISRVMEQYAGNKTKVESTTN